MRCDSVKAAIYGRIFSGEGRVFGYRMMGNREIVMMIIIVMMEMGIMMINEDGVVGGYKMA